MVVGREHSGIEDGINLDSLPKWLRDKIDYDNESAGRSTGRMQRFFTPDDSQNPDSQKKKDERHLSALLRALQNPDYARLYSEAANAVDRAGRAVGSALDEVTRDAQIAGKRLEELRASAATLPGGRRVYQGKDGRIYAEDGEDVTARRDQVTGLSAHAPGWDEYRAAKETADRLEAERLELARYRREVIEPAQERLADPDNPPGEDELEYFRKIEETLPPRARQHLEQLQPQSAPAIPEKSSADEYITSAALSAPKMDAHFSAAASVREPYGSQAPQGPATTPKNN